MTFAEYKEHVGECSACGNSPVNHFVQYLASTTSIIEWGWMAFLTRKFPRTARFFNSAQDALEKFLEGNYPLLIALGGIRLAHDPTKARTYRSQVIWEEAQRRGIKMEQIVIFGALSDIYRAWVRGGWQYFESLPIPPEYGQGRSAWVDDKFLLFETLKKAGVPVPETYSVSSVHAAEKAFEQLGGRVVTKPRVGSRGRHTTTGIQKLENLREGFKSAQKLCRFVLVQKELEGSICRGTVVSGKLVGFFQADPPIVVGNGVDSITKLVEHANKHRHERVGEIVIREEHREFLARRGYTPDSIPPQGERVALTHRTGRLFGGITRELLETVHPDVRTHLEHAADALGLPVVGFDVVIREPEHNPASQEWGIIEANTVPFIDLHYLPLYGTPSNTASAVWDLWEKKLSTSALRQSAQEAPSAVY